MNTYNRNQNQSASSMARGKYSAYIETPIAEETIPYAPKRLCVQRLN
jgi:hypothetical protein